MKPFSQYITEYNDETLVKKIKHPSGTVLMISRYKNGPDEGKYIVRVSKSNYERGKQNRTMRAIHDKPLDAEAAVALFNKRKKSIWKKK